MRKSIFEALTGTHIPRRFWLVLDIPTDDASGDDEWSTNRRNRQNKILSDLSTGSLEGVRGISAGKEIMTDWFVSCRNATLILDPVKLAEANDIEQIRYDDPDYLCRNNFRVCYRLWQKENGVRGLDHNNLMMLLGEYWVKSLREVNYSAYQMLDYNGVASKLAKHWQDHHEQYQIVDVSSAGEAFFDMLPKLEWNGYYASVRIEEILNHLTRDEVVKAIHDAMVHVGRIYSDEAEWIVNSTHLNIPRGSTMLVAVEPAVIKAYPEWKADQTAETPPHSLKWNMLGYRIERYERLMHMIKTYRLDEFYDLRIVDATRFDNVGLKVARRERDARLNKS